MELWLGFVAAARGEQIMGGQDELMEGGDVGEDESDDKDSCI